MTRSEVMASMSRCIEPPTHYVRHVGKVWLVIDRESPGEYLRGPLFHSKRQAVEYAEANANAVYKRLRELVYGNPTEGRQ